MAPRCVGSQFNYFGIWSYRFQVLLRCKFIGASDHLPWEPRKHLLNRVIKRSICTVFDGSRTGRQMVVACLFLGDTFLVGRYGICLQFWGFLSCIHGLF